MDLIIIPILLGWLAGWLDNYLADVLPATRSFSHPACPNCQAPYPWGGYLFFHRCTSCGAPRKGRALALQVILTVAAILLWVFPKPHFPFILAFLLVIFLSLVFVIDLEHRLILHPVSLAGAAIGLGIGIYIHGLSATLIGGAVGFGVMLLFYFAGELYVRYMSKKRGMSPDEVALGFGDVNLSGVMGLLLGWPRIMAGLLFAVIAGGIVSLFIILGMLIARKYRAFTAIPYAPFLILGTLFILFAL